MNKLIKTMDYIGEVQMDLEKNYSDGQFEIFIPFRFVDADMQKVIYNCFNKIAKSNGWQMADYSKSSASFKISYNNSPLGTPSITYEVFIFAEPKNPDEEHAGDDPTYVFTPNLSNADKKVLRKLMVEYITNQIMEMEG